MKRMSIQQKFQFISDLLRFCLYMNFSFFFPVAPFLSHVHLPQKSICPPQPLRTCAINILIFSQILLSLSGFYTLDALGKRPDIWHLKRISKRIHTKCITIFSLLRRRDWRLFGLCEEIGLYLKLGSLSAAGTAISLLHFTFQLVRFIF